MDGSMDELHGEKVNVDGEYREDFSSNSDQQAKELLSLDSLPVIATEDDDPNKRRAVVSSVPLIPSSIPSEPMPVANAPPRVELPQQQIIQPQLQYRDRFQDEPSHGQGNLGGPDEPEEQEDNQPPPGRRSVQCIKKCYMLVCLISAISMCILLFGAIIIVATVASYSTTVPVYEGDIVYGCSIGGFWFNHLTISTNINDVDGNEVNEADFSVYYVEHTAIETAVYNDSSPIHEFSFSQVLIINNSHQNYLLKGSKIEFNFTVENASNLSAVSKICQFDNLDDYRDIIDADSNKSIIDAENKGKCILINDSPNLFEVSRSGYYWYVLSTPLCDTYCIRTSYKYNLIKLYYNSALLGSSHDCSFSDSNNECQIADSVSRQTSTKRVLVHLKGPNNPGQYMVTVRKKNAFGALVFGSIPIAIAVAALVSSLCWCYRHHRNGYDPLQ